MRRLTRLLGVVALLALAAGCTTSVAGTGDPDVHVLRQPGFSVDFPVEPTAQSEEIPGLPGVVALSWTVETVGYAQSVSVVDYPPELPSGDPTAALTLARDGTVASLLGSKLTSSSETTVAGLPAMDFATGVGGGTYRARYVLDGQRLYQLVTVGSGDPVAVHDAFVATFRLR